MPQLLLACVFICKKAAIIVLITEVMWGTNALMHVQCLAKGAAHSKVLSMLWKILERPGLLH